MSAMTVGITSASAKTKKTKNYIYSGYMGNCKWNFNKKSQKLYFSGKGEIFNEYNLYFPNKLVKKIVKSLKKSEFQRVYGKQTPKVIKVKK